MKKIKRQRLTIEDKEVFINKAYQLYMVLDKFLKVDCNEVRLFSGVNGRGSNKKKYPSREYGEDLDLYFSTYPSRISHPQAKEIYKDLTEGEMKKAINEIGWYFAGYVSESETENRKYKGFFFCHDNFHIKSFSELLIDLRKDFKDNRDKYEAVNKLSVLLQKNVFLKDIFLENDESGRGALYTIKGINREINKEAEEALKIVIVTQVLKQISPTDEQLISLLE